jgi:CheY-like chemotaxis protein
LGSSDRALADLGDALVIEQTATCLRSDALAVHNLLALSPAGYMSPDPATSSPPEAAQRPEPLRVLIADDERDSLLTLGMLCRGDGMDVRLVRRGKEVPLAAAEFSPDVILLDLGMPDRSGLDIAEELSERYGQSGPVLIAVTAFSSERDRQMAKESGFHDFIAKPYDPQTLLRRINNFRRRET